jgi:hypothetical protein
MPPVFVSEKPVPKTYVKRLLVIDQDQEKRMMVAIEFGSRRIGS